MNDKEKAQQANLEASKRQSKINDQWSKFANTFGKEAFEDLMAYAESQRKMLIDYGENMAMPHPKQPGEYLPLSSEHIASLLQTSRGINIMRTYIANRVNAGDVAQPKK